MKDKVWFKRKEYGWGWQPASWEGWAVILGHIVLALLISFRMISKGDEINVVFDLYVPIGILTLILIGISWTHGEKPRFQWGEKRSKK